MYKTSNYWSRDMLNSDFLENGLGTVFQEKYFSCYTLLTDQISNFIIWLLLLLEILGNMCIAIVYFPGCDVINFEISLIFLFKPLFYMTKISRQKFTYLENEKSFRGEIKSIFVIFKGLSVVKNCLRPESAPLNWRCKLKQIQVF